MLERACYDFRAFSARATQAGTPAELQVWDDMPHVHQIAFRLVPEGRQALKDIARYFNQHK